jgi:endonuclease/exonuclease/phosphatase family metal-dependent hydrolase
MAARWVVLVCVFHFLAVRTSAAEVLTAMTLNIWGGGLHAGYRIEDVAAAVRASGADVVALQEAWPPDGAGCASETCASHAPSLACKLARALAFHCHDLISPGEPGQNAILSRFPIVGQAAGPLGVRIDVRGREIAVLNLHLPDSPYQPYQLLGIAYGDAPRLDSAAEAVGAAAAARGREVDRALRQIALLGDAPVIVMGDFNEPSHRDWTPRAAAAGAAPMHVLWPSVKRLEDAGFVDAYRAVRPDEVRDPGATWTALPDPLERPERIDFVLARGLRVVWAGVVGERAETADIVVRPWPSDHRGVAAALTFEPPALVSAQAPAEQ